MGKRTSLKKKPVDDRGSYEGNAERLLAFGTVNPSPRVLQSLRVEKEVRKAKERRRLPTVAEIQERYPFNEEGAQKFIRSVERALKKASARTAPVKSKPSPASADPAPVARPPAETPAPPSSSGTQNRKVSHAEALAHALQSIRARFGDEIRQKGEQTTVREGFIYLATHPCFEGWVKAGMTIDYELRLATYNVADPLSRFEMPLVAWVPDRRDSEKALLRELSCLASEMRGEWAHIPLEQAALAFLALPTQAPPPYPT